ncbi:hypothetical protein P3T76_005889 [Phytophthora citrophthora]|uniref:Uncharacterized protein n=1 Tax=Phytophthora citrophthora TaxID=4793 RepID=A0AAD9GPT1_9STRA|nr:hypothetical protein P3T76_005889 [Phytophthora citrophthora]
MCLHIQSWRTPMRGVHQRPNGPGVLAPPRPSPAAITPAFTNVSSQGTELDVGESYDGTTTIPASAPARVVDPKKRKREESNGRSKKQATKVQPKPDTATRKAIAREEKAAKEARAVARVEAEATLRSESKERERKRLAREEKEGAVARHQALDDLKRKRARGISSVKKKKKNECSDKEEEDADDQSERQNQVTDKTSQTTPICATMGVNTSATPSDVLQPTSIGVNVSSILPAAPPSDVGIDVTRTDESTALPTPSRYEFVA